LYARIGSSVMFVQTAAVLEIFHSMFGLVRSPLLPTFFQVMSRLFIVWCYMIPTGGADGHWSLYLCVASWCLVEVPRYLFYFVALLLGGTEKMPSALFFLRYSLFIVLYPSGITGELFIMYTAWNMYANWMQNPSYIQGLGMRCVALHHFMYLPLAPFMVMNMWNNRKRSYKKRARALNPRPLNGLIWPTTDKKGTRSTTKTNKAIWTASVAGVDEKTAIKCGKERNWRFGYSKHVIKNVEVSVASTANALKIARQGLAKAYDLFEFMRDGKTMSFKKAMSKGVITTSFDTHIIKGNKSLSTKLEVPYGGGKYQGKPYYLGKHDNTVISGVTLKEQLAKWVDYGTIEPSAAEAISTVNVHKDWLDLSDKYFVLLGATSAMGPLHFLLKHGANIVAVDLNRDFIWNKLFAAVRDSPGRLIFPVQKGLSDIDAMSDAELAKVSGSDLLSQTPEIANWILQCKELSKAALTVGNYTYLDGALHVQLSLACDSIIKRICDERKNTSIAFLCTPTDDHVINKEAYEGAKDSLKNRGPSAWMSWFAGKANYKCMRAVKQQKGEPIRIIDGIAVAQGPNYALAKRMQHWRAVIAFADGHVISSNIAPSTATKSVVHNAQFAAAYGGMHHFPPMEVMYQETSNAVMSCLLIHDVLNEDAAGNPNSKIAKGFRNPYELFSYGSFHGGVWRCSYKIDKIGIPSAISYYLRTYQMPVIAGTVGFVVGNCWLFTGAIPMIS